MADHNLVPPVSGNRSIPKSRSIPPKRDQHKKQQQPNSSENSQDKKDDGRPSIDEYA